MSRRGARASTFGFIDVLLVLNIMLSALVLLVLPSVNPASEEQNQSPAGNLMAAAAWPAGPTDVDLWVSGPGMTKAVGYSNKSSQIWNLLRDDLGNANDPTPVNFENAFSRGLPAGEYAINVHCFSCGDEVPVHVEVRIASGALITEETVTLRPKQEKTVVRFMLDANGHIVPGSMNQVFKPLRSDGK
jgi:hypothetical protein